MDDMTGLELKMFTEKIAHRDYDTMNFSDMYELIEEARELITRQFGPQDFDDLDWFPSYDTDELEDVA